MENLGKLTLFIIAIACASLNSLLCVHIIISISTLYKIGFIENLSFIQLYGIAFVISIISYKYEKERSEKTKNYSTMMGEIFTRVLTTTISYLISWGFAFIMYSIIS
jgi:hypothetical protein